MLKNSVAGAISVKELGGAYQKAHGHNIHIEEFGATSVEELIGKIPHIAHVSKYFYLISFLGLQQTIHLEENTLRLLVVRLTDRN